MNKTIVWTIVLLISIVPTIVTAAYSNSSIVCTDNSTMTETLTIVVVNASNATQTLNASSYQLQTACQYGCDNVTKSCSPDPFNQNIIMFVIFIGLSGLLIVIYKVF